MSHIRERKIAIVHDELVRRGGAEVVLEELLRIVPQAHVYALYAGEPLLEVDGTTHMIKTTFLQGAPSWCKQHPARLLPLLPLAAEQLDLSRYDLVLSSSSAFAKNIVTRAGVPHVSYCHTPTRYLWDNTLDALRQVPAWRRLPAKVLLHWLRLADYAAAQRVDYFIANSTWTKQRIAAYYRRDAEVVYPPIDTSFYTPLRSKELPAFAQGFGQRGAGQAPFLCVGRLTRSKRFEQAISVCEKLELPLIIAGTGSERARLARLAGKYTRFVGRVSTAELRELYRGARALLQPGEEDFGMATAEALACGTPVIASRQGGAREIIRHGETGLLYHPARLEMLAEALRQFITSTEATLRPETIQQSVLKYSQQAFQAGITQVLSEALHSNKKSHLS